jgi:hypothetical protein
LPSEPLHIFDPRRNLQLQGFAGPAATTAIHNATETGVSISGIFQAAEDFAVLGWWNANGIFYSNWFALFRKDTEAAAVVPDA